MLTWQKRDFGRWHAIDPGAKESVCQTFKVKPEREDTEVTQATLHEAPELHCNTCRKKLELRYRLAAKEWAKLQTSTKGIR